jgi:predicted nucleic acid-binding protein
MFLVVDANIVLSALLTKGKSFDIFIMNKLIKKYEFIAPEFLFFEIGKNFDEIVKRSKLSSEELAKVFKFIKDDIEFIPFKEFNEQADKASSLAPHEKDVQYFALSLAFNCGIWSEEKVFKHQSEVKVFSTKDLMEK